MKYSQLQFCKSYRKKYLLTLEKGNIINHSTKKGISAGRETKIVEVYCFLVIWLAVENPEEWQFIAFNYNFWQGLAIGQSETKFSGEREAQESVFCFIDGSEIHIC